MIDRVLSDCKEIVKICNNRLTFPVKYGSIFYKGVLMSLAENWLFRYDTLPLKHYELDSEGYLRFIAPISKVGMLRYWDAIKNEPYDEYVSEKTLVDSLESFKTKPVTLLHPTVKVTPANSREHSRGLTGYSGFFDGSFLWLTGTATDQELIQKALTGDCRELSCGYDALVSTADSKRFQVKRKGNHLAFVPKGRAGKDVALKLDHFDSNSCTYIEYCCDDDLDAVKVPDQLYDHFRNGRVIVPISSFKEKRNMVQILLADQVYSVDGDDAVLLKTDLANYTKQATEWKTLADQAETVKTQLEESNNQITTLIADKAKTEGELAATKIKLDEATEASNQRLDQDLINTAIKTRLSMWSEVLPYIQKTDSGYQPDYSMDEHQIRLAYLLARKPDQKTYLDSLDLSTESGQKVIEGMYLGLKPSTDTTAQNATHADSILSMIQSTESAKAVTDTKTDSVDARAALQAQLETVKK